jgi:excisionase family DNA binding protein
MFKDAFPDSSREWLRPDQAAAYLSCSPSKLAKDRLYGGGIPFVKIGRLVLYSKTAIDRYLAEKTRRSTSDDLRG